MHAGHRLKAYTVHYTHHCVLVGTLHIRTGTHAFAGKHKNTKRAQYFIFILFSVPVRHHQLAYAYKCTEPKSHLKIEHVLDCCICIPITNTQHSQSYSIDSVFSPCHTRSIIRIRKHAFVFVFARIHVCAGFLYGYYSFITVVIVVPILACVCMYWWPLELFCARCCWVTFTKYNKCAIKWNKTKQIKPVPIVHSIFQNVPERNSYRHSRLRSYKKYNVS